MYCLRQGEKGIQELESLRGDSNIPNLRDRARLLVALKIVDNNPQLAIELVRRCEDADNRGQALGLLTVELAKHDRDTAWQMIDEALAIHRNRDSYGRWVNYGGAGPFAAALAWHAHQAGYPDMESVVWQAVAACRAHGRQSGQERLHATIRPDESSSDDS